MATHSSILAWRILWTEKPGGQLSMESHRVRLNRSDLACTHALEKEMATHSSILAWRIPGTEEPGGLTESDTTEATQQQVQAALITSHNSSFVKSLYCACFFSLNDFFFPLPEKKGPIIQQSACTSGNSFLFSSLRNEKNCNLSTFPYYQIYCL